MVEFYQPIKKRGIAGKRTTRVVETPKPYWPGLEIDEFDRKKANRNSVNVTSNNSNNFHINSNVGTTNAEKSSFKTGAESSAKNRILFIDRLAKSSDSGNINGREERAGTLLGSSNELGKETDTKDSKGNCATPSPSANTNTNTNTNTCSSRNGTPTSRSKKRKRKRPFKNNIVEDNKAALPKLDNNNNHNHNDNDNHAVEEHHKHQHQQARKSVVGKDTAGNGNGTNSGNERNGNHEGAIQSQTTALLVAREKSSETISRAKTNTPTSDQQARAASGVSGPTASTNSTTATTAIPTPRVLIRLLLKKKFPVLEECVSNIRDILLGMVSGSPALLQKRLTATETSSPSSPLVSSQSSSTINDDINADIHTTTNNDVIKSDHGGETQIQTQTQTNYNDIRQQEAISKFEVICKRQEVLLDRIDGLESAAAKREEEFCRHTLERKQQQHQHHLREEDVVAQLQIDNSILKLQLQEAKESKESIQKMFQSRLDEQFRELAQRDGVAKKQRQELITALMENEMLRNKLTGLLDKGRTTQIGDDAHINPPFEESGTAAAAKKGFRSGTAPNAAYHSNRIRHRHGQDHGQAQQQKRSCCLQSIAGSHLDARKKW